MCFYSQSRQPLFSQAELTGQHSDWTRRAVFTLCDRNRFLLIRWTPGFKVLYIKCKCCWISEPGAQGHLPNHSSLSWWNWVVFLLRIICWTQIRLCWTGYCIHQCADFCHRRCKLSDIPRQVNWRQTPDAWLPLKWTLCTLFLFNLVNVSSYSLYF